MLQLSLQVFVVCIGQPRFVTCTHDTTRRGAHLVAVWLALPACLLSSFWHRVNHNFAPSFTTVSTVGHVSETTCQIYHGIARHRLAWRLGETWLRLATLGLAWPTGTPTCTPREQIEIQLCGSTPGMAGQFPAAAANDQLP